MSQIDLDIANALYKGSYFKNTNTLVTKLVRENTFVATLYGSNVAVYTKNLGLLHITVNKNTTTTRNRLNGIIETFALYNDWEVIPKIVQKKGKVFLRTTEDYLISTNTMVAFMVASGGFYISDILKEEETTDE